MANSLLAIIVGLDSDGGCWRGGVLSKNWLVVAGDFLGRGL